MRLVGEVVGVLGDGVGAEVVEFGDEGVEVRGGGVAREPEGFAVVGDARACVVVFLTLVDDGNACCGFGGVSACRGCWG